MPAQAELQTLKESNIDLKGEITKLQGKLEEAQQENISIKEKTASAETAKIEALDRLDESEQQLRDYIYKQRDIKNKLR